MESVAEHLCHINKALDSIPSTTTKITKTAIVLKFKIKDHSGPQRCKLQQGKLQCQKADQAGQVCEQLFQQVTLTAVLPMTASGWACSLSLHSPTPNTADSDSVP